MHDPWLEARVGLVSERRRRVVGGVGVHALRDRRGENNGLEGRSGLPPCLGGEVELIVLLARYNARHRLDRSRPRIDGDDRRGRVGAVVEVFTDRLFGQTLHARVDRRVDLQPSRLHGLGAVLLDQLIGDVVEEVRLLDVFVDVPPLEDNRRGDGLLVLGEADVLVVEHRLQHFVSARQRRGPVVERVVSARRLGQAGEKRGLHERQLARVLGEVGLGGGLHAVGVRAVEDLVHVGGQDALLRPGVVELARQADLLQLAAHGALVVGDVEGARKLLSDRRCSLDGLASAEVGDGGSYDPDVVDAAVLVEAPVFDRNDGLRHPG